MITQSRMGAIVGGISIVFSTLCFLVTPVFTAAMILAALFGICSGGIALGLKARRTAMVAFIFALTPLAGFLLMEYVVEQVRAPVVIFLPLVLAVAFAIHALMGYFANRKRAGAVSS